MWSLEAHYWAKFNEAKTSGSILDNFKDEKQFDAMDRYSTSKLLDIFMAREIAALPAAANVTVNSVNPGLSRSQLRRSLPAPIQL